MASLRSFALLLSLAAPHVAGLAIGSPHGLAHTSTFSPKARARMHDNAFEAEFTMSLNMTDAHETGKKIGLRVDTDTNFEPVTIQHVNKHGLVEDWNKAHPDQQAMVGDQIVKVNHIQWHHNSQTFAQRIKAQWMAGAKAMPGAGETLELSIQRPHRVVMKRTDTQRAQRHDQLFSKEFTVDLNTTVGHETGKPLGLGLVSDVDHDPVTVDKVKRLGLVQDWNQAHPEDQVLVGDQITQVNHIMWHHNSKNFSDRIDTQFKLARKSNLPLKLVIQRPRREESAKKQAQKEAFSKKFAVDLNMTEGHQTGKPIGLSWTSDVDAEPITIDKVKRVGLVQDWNQAHPEDQVLVGDQIIKVNQINWHLNSKNFTDRINTQFKGARQLKNSLKLFIQRPRREEARRTPKRTQAQTHAQLRNEAFSKEFTVDLDTTMGHETGKPLGLGLASDVDDKPVTVDKVRRLGLVQDWNQAHPEDQVLVGDQIIKVNHIMWHHNSKNFSDRIDTQFKFARQSKSPLKLVIQRPRKPGERVSASPAGYVDSVGGSESGNDDNIGPSGYVDSVGGSEDDCPDCIGGSE